MVVVEEATVVVGVITVVVGDTTVVVVEATIMAGDAAVTVDDATVMADDSTVMADDSTVMAGMLLSRWMMPQRLPENVKISEKFLQRKSRERHPIIHQFCPIMHSLAVVGDILFVIVGDNCGGFIVGDICFVLWDIFFIVVGDIVSLLWGGGCHHCGRYCRLLTSVRQLEQCSNRYRQIHACE